MKNKKDKERAEFNEKPVSLAVFFESYNKSIPPTFPKATISILKKFENTHPDLFKQKDGWSVDRHRKRLMDWLASYDNS
ncbi:MAG TPA: hypothetical protein VJH71_00770 [Candidatus Paceibacterota bacterium]